MAQAQVPPGSLLVGYLSVISAMTQISVCLLLLLDQVTAGPNVVMILADDLGVNDVSWNNPRVSETPSLGRLAREGLTLDSAYTLPVCSPSRAALLTGIYPFKYGFQVLTTFTRDSVSRLTSHN